MMIRLRPRLRPVRGFTLLEMLLAIGLIAAILMVASSLLRDVAEARDRIERRLRRAEGATLALDLLADRLATATVTAIDGRPGIVGDALSMRVTGCGVASIRLAASSRRSPLLDRSTLELAWRDGGLAIRDDEADWSLLAPGLTAIRFRYHDGDDWRDDWDAGRDGLPTAIEVAIWETPWPDGLVASWMPEPDSTEFDEDPLTLERSDADESDPWLDDLEGFAPPPMPAADDEIPVPDRRRIVAILDPVSASSESRPAESEDER